MPLTRDHAALPPRLCNALTSTPPECRWPARAVFDAWPPAGLPCPGSLVSRPHLTGSPAPGPLRQVARKVVMLENDLERAEERAETGES